MYPDVELKSLTTPFIIIIALIFVLGEAWAYINDSLYFCTLYDWGG